MMKTIFHWLGFAAVNFVGASLLATQGLQCREHARSPSRSLIQVFGAWLLALLPGLLLISPLAAIAAPAPEITLSLRGVGDAIVEQGEPLRIAVRIRVPRGAKEAIKLAPASGTWADTVRVEIAPASGGAAAVLAEAVGKPDGAQATLDKAHVAGGLWRISAEAMQRLAPGNYVVRARLTIAGGSGWTGEAVSAPTRLQVVAASNAADRVTQRAVNRAHDALLTGRVEEAASILDAVLTNSPDDGRLLTARAVVAERAGNIIAAILCAKRAERARPPTSTGPPPVELQELQTRLQLALPEAMKRSDKPAEWTWPPPSVMKMPDSMMPPLPKANAPSASAVAAPATPAPKSIPAVTPVASTAPVVVLAPAPASPPVVVARFPVASAGLPSPGEMVPADQLNDAKVSADTAGQWATTATAGSQYDKTQYSAARATGAPDVPVAGNSPEAWCPAVRNVGMDWLEVTFANPVSAVEVRARQSDASGAIAKVEAIEPDGTAHVWWEGADPYKAPAIREIVWFAVRVPKTAYLVARIKLTLNLASGPGYKQIDAVQLVGNEP